MAESLATELAASETFVATGAGTVVDLGTRRNAVKMTVACTAYTVVDQDPTPSVLVAIQTSTSESGPWTSAGTVSVTATGSYSLRGFELSQYVRASWTFTNMTSAVFSIAGTAYTVYALSADITRYAVTEVSIEDMTATQRADALTSATDMAEGYLSSAYEMPILGWGEDLKSCVARLAAATLFRVRGADPQGPDALVFDGESKAIQWLDRIASGRLKPPAILDSTPDATEGGSYIYTQTTRGW
jgi:hypothetical protein